MPALNLIPDPLHPAIVHFPIVLAVLTPLVVVMAIRAISRGAKLRSAWAVVLLAFAFTAVAAFASVQTGGAQAEQVEQSVGETAVEAHEEAAELFEISSFVMLAIATMGLANGKIGSVARGVTAVGSLVLLAMVVNVGHSGGRLVYGTGGVAAVTGAGDTGAGESEGR